MSNLTKPYIEVTKQWIEKFVIGLNLCPFAKKPFATEKIRYIVFEAQNHDKLLACIIEEMHFLDANADYETTLIILVEFLHKFDEFFDFVGLTELLLEETDYEGIYQIASFHPEYQFEGTIFEDVENFTNRSPFPMLHLLREDSITDAVNNYPDIDQIPEKNIDKMNELGVVGIKHIFDEINRSN
jgi:uncharacterized protein